MPKPKVGTRRVVGQDDAAGDGDAAGAGDGGETTESRGAATWVARCRAVANGWGWISLATNGTSELGHFSLGLLRRGRAFGAMLL
jgi:hypothetical protein